MGDASMFRHILVPLDGSRYAEMALVYAQNLAQLTGARVTLLTAVRHHEINMPRVGQLDEQNRMLALDYLKPIQQRLKDAGIDTDVRVMLGEPAQAVADLAGETEVDLICMTSRGLGGKGPYVLGSNAVKTLQTAPCPVLVLRITERP